MIYCVYDPCDDETYYFTTREKAREYINYLKYMTDRTVDLRIDRTSGEIDKRVKDITKQRLGMGARTLCRIGDKPCFSNYFMGRVYPTPNKVGTVEFSMDRIRYDSGDYIEYYLYKVYQVQNGESADDFHKRILKDMNEELARQIEGAKK